MYLFGMTQDGPVYHTMLSDDEFILQVAVLRPNYISQAIEDGWTMWQLPYNDVVEVMHEMAVAIAEHGGDLDAYTQVMAETTKLELTVGAKQPIKWFFWWEL